MQYTIPEIELDGELEESLNNVEKAIKEIKGLRVVKENNISDDCVFGIACYKYCCS